MLGNFEHCIACGKLFAKIKRPICGECMQKERETAKKVRQYLKQQEGEHASTLKIAEALNVPIRYIEYLVREGYFDVVRYPNLKYQCRGCDKEITAGEYCKNCLTDMRQEVLDKKLIPKDEVKVEQTEEKKAPLYRSRDLFK